MWHASVISSPMDAFVLGALVLVVGVISVGVYLDSQRVGMSHPVGWSVLVFAGWALTTVLFVLTDAPVAGLLVIGIGATALYLFERDDHLHGDEPADPRTLHSVDDEHRRDGEPEEGTRPAESSDDH